MIRHIRRIVVVVPVIAVAVTLYAEDKDKTDSVINVELDDLELKIDRKSTFTLKDAPTQIRKLHGRRVRLHGYMYPTFKAVGLTEFLLNGETKKSLTILPLDGKACQFMFSSRFLSVLEHLQIIHTKHWPLKVDSTSTLKCRKARSYSFTKLTTQL